jgi:hypothetical protein
MRVHIGRTVAAAAVAELLGVAILAALVVVFGPSGFKEVQLFAAKLGSWVGPISGVLLCILGGWWVAGGVPLADKVLNGIAMGFTAAITAATIRETAILPNPLPSAASRTNMRRPQSLEREWIDPSEIQKVLHISHLHANSLTRKSLGAT